MIFSRKGLVMLALCYIILMVSLGKCEIDPSSSVITTTTTTTPEKGQPGEEETLEKTLFSHSLDRALSIPSSQETVKTSSSYSSSSSSSRDVAAAAVPFNNANEQWQEQQWRQQQQADAPYNANIISGTITPNVVSPILTSLAVDAPQQEVGDSDREEVAQQKQGQQQEQNRFVTVQNQDSRNNEGQAAGAGETISSSSGASQTFFNYNNNINAKYYEKMTSESGSHFPEKATTISSSRAEARPRTTARHSIDSFAIKPRLPSSSLPRGQGAVLVSRFVANKDKFFSSSVAAQGNEERLSSEENDSPITAHTEIPTGLTFSCKNRVPGYYADSSSISKCQVYHMCMTDGRKYTLLCGIGTVFNQLTFVCDHWYNYNCKDAETDYKINRQLWEEFVGDDGSDTDEDELENHNADDDDPSGVIENDAVHQSMPLRSPFTITSKVSKTHDAFS